MSRKKDLYVNTANEKRYETVLQECKRRGISPSDLFINSAYKALSEAAASRGGGEYLPVKQDFDILKKMIEIANNMRTDGVDGLNLSYVLPRRFETGEISLSDLTNLIMMIMQFSIVLAQTQVFKDALLITGIGRQSIRNLESESFSDFYDILSRNIEKCQKEELESRKRQQRIKELRYSKQEWEIKHPDIPFHLRKLSPYDLEVFKMIDSGQWVEILE